MSTTTTAPAALHLSEVLDVARRGLDTLAAAVRRAEGERDQAANRIADLADERDELRRQRDAARLDADKLVDALGVAIEAADAACRKTSESLNRARDVAREADVSVVDAEADVAYWQANYDRELAVWSALVGLRAAS